MKHINYIKFLICIILVLTICLCLLSCSSGISDKNEAASDADNQLPTADYSTSDNNIFEAKEASHLMFSSVEEFKNAVVDGNLSQEQKEIINQFPKDENGQTLTFDLHNLQTPVLPKNVSVSSILWDGLSYCYYIDIDDGGYGTINYHTYSRDTYTYKLSQLDNVFKSDHITITEQEFLDDGKGGEKTVIYCTTPMASLKIVRYSLDEGNKIFTVEKIFCLEVNHSLLEPSETVPQQIALYSVEGDEYYIIHLFGLTEDPSDEWLLDFGLKKYVDVSASKE